MTDSPTASQTSESTQNISNTSCSTVRNTISVVQSSRKDKSHSKVCGNVPLHSKNYNSAEDWQNIGNVNWNTSSTTSNSYDYRNGSQFLHRYHPPPSLTWPPVQSLVRHAAYPSYPPPQPPFSSSIPPPLPITNHSMNLVPPVMPPSNVPFTPPPTIPQGTYGTSYGMMPNHSPWNYYSGPPVSSSWGSGPPLPPQPPPPPPLPPLPGQLTNTVSHSDARENNELEMSSISSASSEKSKYSNLDASKNSYCSRIRCRSKLYSNSRRSGERHHSSKRSNVDSSQTTSRRLKRDDNHTSKSSPLSRSSTRNSERANESHVCKSSDLLLKDRSRSIEPLPSNETNASESKSFRQNQERLTREPGNREKEREEPKAKSKRSESNLDCEQNLEREFSCDSEKEPGEETTEWLRCSPAELYYHTSHRNPQVKLATQKLISLHDRFKRELVDRVNKIHEDKQINNQEMKRPKVKSPKVSDSSGSEMSFGESSEDEEIAIRELERKKQHPDRLHEELWYNDPGEMNDGPLCRCSLKARRTGIRHGIYPGEGHLEKCDPHSNNADRLFHYRITMSPHTNFLTKFPTIIRHDDHEFIFEGFSLLSHYEIGTLPTCKVIRFNIEYTIHYIEEKIPENFTICGIQIFNDYLFNEILELVDLDLRANGDDTGCKRFHFFPRFARAIEENGKEILSMNVVQKYLLDSNKPLVNEADIPRLMKMNEYEWQNFTEKVKGMIVTYPGKKPSSLRVDQLDRDVGEGGSKFPEIVHFGIRPLQLSYAGNPSYQKAWREYVKYRHLLANKPKVSYQDRHKLMQKEMRLQEMRTKSNLKRDVTVVVSSEGFYRTGIMCDIVQHAMLLPVLVCHLRFHKSLDILEERIGHKFHDRFLLQLALTHPSYRENFGTNPDHARNALTNCGIRQPEYGDRRIHYANTRKRGINTLINIMSRFGKPRETVSNINHNERLEFLGDAVVEFLTSIHLFHLFPDIEEGGLATYRAAIVQNQHLAVLAKKLQLDHFMLYAHGSDLCHDLELRHAMANCFEALMGALFLDGQVEAADRVFCNTLFSDPDLLDVWVNYPSHPIQEQEPDGDRQWIASVPLLKKVMKFEEKIGVQFNHIRLLARAFTHRSVGYNNLTLGSNQRLEFLGDTVLQLVASEYLYKYFPEHHEGHLSLLRSSLVNNRTQSVVCDDLGMVDYAIYAYPKGELKIKDRADLLEAFLGALYVDQGLEYCRVFCQVCFFPRLQHFIMNQDWNDPKSKLQQCCLTLRTMDGGEPDIPVYKVIESKGPTNTRVFTVAVYFRGKRLAKGSGHSIQQAEMAAANKALKSSSAELFPQLNHQRRVIERSLKQHQIRNAEMQAKRESEVQNVTPQNEVDDNRKMAWCI